MNEKEQEYKIHIIENRSRRLYLIDRSQIKAKEQISQKEEKLKEDNRENKYEN